MQLMGTAFGGKVVPGSMGGYAEVDVEVIKEDDILKGLPARFKDLGLPYGPGVCPSGGIADLARSAVCEIEAMRAPGPTFIRGAVAP